MEEELSPDFIRDIHKGLLDCHFGKLFTSDEVFAEKLKPKITAKLKRLYWRAMKPIWAITHRNCDTCKKYKTIILSGEL